MAVLDQDLFLAEHAVNGENTTKALRRQDIRVVYNRAHVNGILYNIANLNIQSCRRQWVQYEPPKKGIKISTEPPSSNRELLSLDTTTPRFQDASSNAFPCASNRIP